MWDRNCGATLRLMAVRRALIHIMRLGLKFPSLEIGVLVTLFLQLICNRGLCLTLNSSGVVDFFYNNFIAQQSVTYSCLQKISKLFLLPIYLNCYSLGE
jgi:hypothetical protein